MVADILRNLHCLGTLVHEYFRSSLETNLPPQRLHNNNRVSQRFIFEVKSPNLHRQNGTHTEISFQTADIHAGSGAGQSVHWKLFGFVQLGRNCGLQECHG